MNDNEYRDRIADATAAYHAVITAALDHERDVIMGLAGTVADRVAHWAGRYPSVFDLPHVVAARERYDAALATLRQEWPDHPYWGE